MLDDIEQNENELARLEADFENDLRNLSDENFVDSGQKGFFQGFARDVLEQLWKRRVDLMQ